MSARAYPGRDTARILRRAKSLRRMEREAFNLRVAKAAYARSTDCEHDGIQSDADALRAFDAFHRAFAPGKVA